MCLSPIRDSIFSANRDADTAAGSFVLLPKFMTDALTFGRLVNSVRSRREHKTRIFFSRERFSRLVDETPCNFFALYAHKKWTGDYEMLYHVVLHSLTLDRNTER